MELKRGALSLKVNTHAEITELTWQGHPLLHDGKTHWSKVYPMIFPVVSHSRAFEVNGLNYAFPKHGFWRELNWLCNQSFTKNKLVCGAYTKISSRYPFALALLHEISLEDNALVITTSVANAGPTSAYFHFGHHPAFVIDEQSTLTTSSVPWQISLTGALVRTPTPLAPLMTMPFGETYDTLVFKNHAVSQLALNAPNARIIFDVTDFASVQIWKPRAARFVCIEPWQGTNDDEGPLVTEAARKENIVALAPREVRRFRFAMQFASPDAAVTG